MSLIPSRNRNKKREIEEERARREIEAHETARLHEQHRIEQDREYEDFKTNFKKREKYCTHFEGQQYTDHLAKGTE